MMKEEVGEALFMREYKRIAHYSLEAEQTTATPGRAIRQQARTQEAQQLRKALQEHCALQWRLAASATGWGAGALIRHLRKLASEVSKLKDMLAEQEDAIWDRSKTANLGKAYLRRACSRAEGRRSIKQN